MGDDGLRSSLGLYSGFEGYQSPTDDDFRRVMRTGLVVPDANLLLNLYRYNPDARKNLLTVLAKLSTSLWVPHQVLVEFWRNRESVMRDPGDSNKTIETLGTLRNKALNELRAWANRVYLPPDQRDSLEADLRNAFGSTIDALQEFVRASTEDLDRNTYADSVLKELESILDGNVGPPLSAEEHRKAVVEGLRRVGAQEPPGYKDKRKDDDRAAGDYLVWRQMIVEAENRRADVLFVTSDVKEDWWREEGGERRGPRVELVDELRRVAGQNLYMLRPAQLLKYASKVFEVQVSPDSVREVEQVDSLVSESEELPPFGGWTISTLSSLLIELGRQAPVQAGVLRAAAETGFVDRETAYAIGNYPSNRTLRGFTRPIRRLTQELRLSGELDEDPVDVLWAVYDDDSPEFGWASGFRVHPLVLPLLREVTSTHDPR